MGGHIFASSASVNAAYGGVDRDENWNAGQALVDETSSLNHVGRRPEGISDNAWELLQQYPVEVYDAREHKVYDPNKQAYRPNPNLRFRRRR